MKEIERLFDQLAPAPHAIAGQIAADVEIFAQTRQPRVAGSGRERQISSRDLLAWLIGSIQVLPGPARKFLAVSQTASSLAATYSPSESFGG